ncbi:hypothetical protein SLA2020_385840 [Shorea laevis]
MDILQRRQLRQGGVDYWMWNMDSNGKYTVKSAYRMLQSRPIPSRSINYKMIWNKMVPLKVSGFAWKATQNRIPTKDNLAKRGLRNVEDIYPALSAVCNKKAQIISFLLVRKLGWCGPHAIVGGVFTWFNKTKDGNIYNNIQD